MKDVFWQVKGARTQPEIGHSTIFIACPGLTCKRMNDDMAKKSVKPEPTRYYTPKEAEAILRVSTQTLRRWAKQGKISGFKLPNGHARYDLSGLIAVMSAPAPVAPTKPAARAPDAPRVVIVEPKVEQVPAYAAPVDSPKPAPIVVPPLMPADLKAQIEAIAARV